MLAMEHDGVLIDGACYDQGRETLDLPATLVLDDDSMLDDVFNVVFDRLGCCVIELRIHAEDERYRRAA